MTVGRVLVIDHKPEIRDAVRDHLVELGYRVRAASDAVTVLADVREFQPDVVLLDLDLPHLSGLDALTVLRLHDETLPVIVTGGAVDTRTGKRLLARGAFELVTRPLDFATLDPIVASAVAARNLTQRLA